MGNYYLYILARFITRLFPMRIGYAMGMFVADCHYYLSKTDRRAVEENLKVILKLDHVDQGLVRQVFRNFGKYLADFFTMTKNVNADYIRKHVRLERIEYLNEALKYGKGCIVVSAHLGNWELGGAVLSLLGYPLSAIALPHKDARVNKFFNDQREFFGSTVIPTTSVIRRCIEHMRLNRVVAILAERDFNNNGVVMDFLGRPTKIPKGAALFSWKTGAPIIPAFFIREDNDDFCITFGQPIYPPGEAAGKIEDEAVKGLIEQYIRPIEEQIRRHPTQWLMFRQFWAS